MKISCLYKVISFIVLLQALYLNAQEKPTWSFDFSLGAVANIPMPLNIHQQGYPDISLVAKYYTEPFTPPVYWDWRFSRWKNNKGWEFEAIHHKLYLAQKPADIQQFSISHGMNLLYINRGWRIKGIDYKAGAGVALTHPENRIRTLENDQFNGIFGLGYHISGPALNLAIGKRIILWKRLYLNTEAKATFAYAYVPVALGHADVYNLSFHIAAGLGYDFIKK